MNGGKDIKIGHDKRPVSIVPISEEPLYNIANGEILTDEFGNPLVTEVPVYYTPDVSQKRATSIVFTTEPSAYRRGSVSTVGLVTATYSEPLTNNIGLSTSNLRVGDLVLGAYIPEATIISRIGIGNIFISNKTTNTSTTSEIIEVKRKSTNLERSDPVLKIEEQFKESSQVSTTLLGVDRAEEQLSLFANVSSYGIDNSEFEFYAFNAGNSFGSWENRKNLLYGNRYTATLTEEVQESAIRLTAFPAPYSYPFGPKFEKLGYYNNTFFQNYIRFIELGNKLYEYYDTGPGSSYPTSWRDKFLSREIAKPESGDVLYLAGIQASFAQIDVWTDTWRDIRDNILIDPVTGDVFNFSTLSSLQNIGLFDSTNTRPGYSSSNQRYAYLQSRRVFRYQPGRISGFTFGLRSSVEPVPGITLEWGISNPTDQYIFQIDAGQFSIIRRSTIPLGADVLQRNGLTLSDQEYISSGDPYDTTSYWTIRIPRDKFNGDPLNSNGPSGYLLQPENVTMYKIEFGWYGAIGARFYVYIPAGNGEARWVVVHTLVIENSLDTPCLQDSYFRFKYSLNISDTSGVRTPQYIYKYGTSYYIDGGDEGTSQIYSVSSKEKTLSSANQKTILGVYPKNSLLNSSGIEVQNKKIIIPTSLNVTTDSLSEVKVVTCTACPGFGHVYAPGIATTETGRYVDLEFTGPDTIAALNDSYFSIEDIGAKLIAPSIYDAYIEEVEDQVGAGNSYLSAKISRSITGEQVIDRVTGSITTVDQTTYPYPVRLSNYNVTAASNFKFTGSKIEIQFANPVSQDDYSHYANFLIGLTDVEPDVSLPNTLNGFNITGTGVTTVLPNSSILYGEFAHTNVALNEEGIETSETFASSTLTMEIDNRIPNLSNPGGGVCSKLTAEILDPIEIVNVNEFDYIPDSGSTTPDPLGRRWIQVSGQFPPLNIIGGQDFGYDGGQIAILDNDNVVVPGETYVGVTSTYTDANSNRFSYIEISGTLSAGSDFTILIRPVKVTGTRVNSQKLYNYNPYPLYLVAKLHDNSSINNITVKETIGNFQRTITPKFYVSDGCDVTDASGNADITGLPPTNFQEIDRLSSALVDDQNEQKLRPSVQRDTLYIGANSTESIDLKKTFGIDRNVITPDNNNLEATFITAKKIDSGSSGTVEMTLNFSEQ
jgi:hypothetical protein